MTSLESHQIVSRYLNTILYENLDLIPPDKSLQEIKLLVSKGINDCKEDSVIKCQQSHVELNNLGIFCKSSISKTTKIGPYGGEFYSIAEEDKCVSRERMTIYEVGENEQPEKISGYLVSSPVIENWMQFIRYARNKREVNLNIVQDKSQIFFIAIRDIQENEELLIWYGDFYNLKCGVPSMEIYEGDKSERSTPTPEAECNGASQGIEMVTPFPHSRQHNERSRDQLLHGLFLPSEDGPKQKVWKCVRCTKTFISTGSLRAHARIHTGEKPYTCSYCQRSFCQMSTLRSHIRLHTGEKPFKCSVCHRSFTQSAGLRSHKKTHKVSPVFLTPNRRSPNRK